MSGETYLSFPCPGCGEAVTVVQTYEHDTGAYNIDIPPECEGCGEQLDEEDLAEVDLEPGEPPEPPEPDYY